MSRSRNRNRCGRNCVICGIPANLRVENIRGRVADADLFAELLEYAPQEDPKHPEYNACRVGECECNPESDCQ